MKVISKTAETQIKAKIKKLEAQRADTHKDIGFHGNDQDGWHGEAYQLSMIEFFTLESKLNDLKKQLHNSEVVAAKDNGKVSVGNEITIEIDGKIRKFIFDGISYDNNVITPESPIGNAIYGKKVGDEVEYNLPSGQKTLKILEINIT